MTRRPNELSLTAAALVLSASVMSVMSVAACRHDASPTNATPVDAALSTVIADASPAATNSGSPADAILRDEQTVTIDGVVETWRLEWRHPPLPDCMDAVGAATCQCAGIAFGERGELDLVRTRPGAPEERLPLTPLFENRDARLVRWDAHPVPKHPSVREKSPPSAPLAPPPPSTPPKHVLVMGDYDHDGRATELTLQVGTSACGHTPTALIGISKTNPKLHAFASVEAPKDILTFDHAADWQRLLVTGALDSTQVACGDHGSDQRIAVVAHADGQLHVETRTTPCPP